MTLCSSPRMTPCKEECNPGVSANCTSGKDFSWQAFVGCLLSNEDIVSRDCRLLLSFTSFPFISCCLFFFCFLFFPFVGVVLLSPRRDVFSTRFSLSDERPELFKCNCYRCELTEGDFNSYTVLYYIYYFITFGCNKKDYNERCRI